MADILIVDDDEAFRDMLFKALERAGHHVRAASDGNVALQFYSSDPSDLVILDIVMPEREGTDTIMALRRLEPTVKIVAMSGGGLTNAGLNLKVARKLGARRTLQKPFTLKEMLDAVTAVLSES